MDKNIAFSGMNGFTWWVGVVENRLDPLKLGRCQIRMFGWHTDNKQLIPTEGLSWALPSLPTNNSRKSKTPLEGDWVYGFFMDGNSGQFPVMMGVMPAIPFPGELDPKTGQPINHTVNPDIGFNDARTPAQLAASPVPFGLSTAVLYPYLIGEPTTSRLYRNENLSQTQIGVRNANLVTGIPVAGGDTWSEPKSPYAAVHPYNDVTESESGHLFELDDTKGAERVNLSHKIGTYMEIGPDGSRVTKIVKDEYTLVVGDNWINVQGNCNVTVNADVNLKVLGNITAEVAGDVDLTVDGDVNAESNNLNITGTVNVSGDINQTGSLNTSGSITAGGDIAGASIEAL